jgi:hypothetical protein
MAAAGSYRLCGVIAEARVIIPLNNRAHGIAVVTLCVAFPLGFGAPRLSHPTFVALLATPFILWG